MIEAQQLTRRYGEFTAVDGVSFAVDEGEIVGILGPNGAGKTTTIRMITGFLPPTSGRVTVGGRDLFADGVAVRRQIGYLPENVALYQEMRVTEYLGYRAQLMGMTRGEAASAIGRRSSAACWARWPRQIIGTLSRGYRQRVALAAAILHDPGMLVLDEPTVGLDPKQIVAIRELIRELGQQRDAAAVDPHPARGRAALRPGDDHRPGPHRRLRHARQPARELGGHDDPAGEPEAGAPPAPASSWRRSPASPRCARATSRARSCSTAPPAPTRARRSSAPPSPRIGCCSSWCASGRRSRTSSSA